MTSLTGSAGCGSCGGGEAGTYTYAYGTNGSYPGSPTAEQEYNTWKEYVRTTEPSGVRRAQFANVYGQVVFDVVQEMTGETIDHKWITHTKYGYGTGDAGRAVEERLPSACTGYTASESSGWVTDVTASDTGTSGLVRLYDYDDNGNLAWEKVREGTSSAQTAYWLRKYTYTSVTYDNYTTYHPLSEFIYPTATDCETHADRLETSHAYSFYQDGGSSTHLIEWDNVTSPAVTTAKNGSNSATQVFYHYKKVESSGDVVQYYNDWTKHEDGTLSYRGYNTDDELVISIEDVDTDQIGDFSGLPSGWSSPNGLHLKTTYTYDSMGRTETVTYPNGLKTKTAYMCTYDAGRNIGTTSRLVALSTPHIDGDDDYDYVPMSIEVTDLEGRTVCSVEGTATTDEDGNLCNDWTKGWTEATTSIEDAFSGTLTTRTDSQYNDKGQLEWTRRYRDIPSDGAGSAGVNYYQTSYTYDSTTGRQYRTDAEDGTITITTVDKLGRAKETWVGTDATGASGDDPDGGGAPNNMVKVSETYYDGATTSTLAVGDGNRTLTKAYDGTDYYSSYYNYDFRNRLTEAVGPDGVLVKRTLDNLGRTTVQETYKDDGDHEYDGGDTLYAKSETSYDERGQVYESVIYEVTAGSAGDSLTTDYWYDARGRQVKTASPNGLFSKTTYDGAGRVTAQYMSYDSDETAYADADDVSGDTVLTQTEMAYDDAGRTWLVTQFERNHDGTGEGALTTSNARVTYAVTWFDTVHRTTHSAFYGTNGGAVLDEQTDDFDPDTGGTQTYANFTPAANGSDKIIVTEYYYDDAGRLYRTKDNKAKETRTTFDDLSRRTQVVENYVDGSVGNTEYDSDRTTQYAYDYKGRMTKLTAKNPTGTSVEDQDTYYIFEDDTNASLPTAVVYPDTTDTVALSSGVYTITAGSDHVATTYDRLGRRLTVTEQRGTVHTYGYDSSGRLEHDRVTTVGTDVDDTVLRITRVYDDIGRADTVNSYDCATAGSGTALNGVKYTYDGWGNLDKVYQDHSGAADTGDLYVDYTYDDCVTSGQAKYVRRSEVIYPNGRKLHYTYGSAGSIADRTNAVAAIKNDSSGSPGTSVVEYTRMGGGTMVVKDYPTPDVKLDYFGGTSGTYAGFDQFGRVVKHNWYDYGSSSDVFDIRHGYDRASNRTYADRQVYKSRAQYYTYDNLHRLATFKAGKIDYDESSVPEDVYAHWQTRKQDWTLDALGNAKELEDHTVDPWFKGTYNKANEYADEDGSWRASGTYKERFIRDDFDTDTSANYEMPAGSGDSLTVTSGYLYFDTVTQDTYDSHTEDSARAFCFIGESIGACQVNTQIRWTVDSGEGGIVFGYQDPNNYWMYVIDAGANQRRLYQVTNGTKTLKASYASGNINANTWYWVGPLLTRGVCTQVAYTFPNGLPAGKVGLTASGTHIQFDYFENWDDATWVDTLWRWTNCYLWIFGSDDKLELSGGHERIPPALLKTIRLDKFRVTFSLRRDAYAGGAYFVFNVKDQNHLNCLRLYNNGTQTVPIGYERIDGGLHTVVSSTGTAANVETAGTTDYLWVRIQCDGSNVTVKTIKDNTGPPSEGDWSAKGACYTSSNFDMDGGYLGFSGGKDYADDLTVESWDGDSWEVEAVENFAIDANGFAEIRPTHDAAGNLTYDGIYAYVYDPWNRLTHVKRAYRNSEGTWQTTSTVGILRYDGMGRRIVKIVGDDCATTGEVGDWECTYHAYYDGHSLIETRNGSNQVIKQHVWGTQYIDELVQVGLNDDPEDEGEDTCETTYWALQDANYNLLAILEADGDLAERYEYTPYGQRTVYKSAGTDDPLAMSPLIDSQAWTVSSIDQPWGICDVGHQGLFFDKEWGLYNNRARMLHPAQGRFLQRDPLGYANAKSLFEAYGSEPLSRLDPQGLEWQVTKDNLDRGLAETRDNRDSFASLGNHKYVRLNPDKYDQWLMDEETKAYVSRGEKPVLCHTYSWPNKFWVFMGKPAWGTWYWDVEWVSLPIKWAAEADGRSVKHNWLVTKPEFERAMKDEDTWGFAFSGHGNVGHIRLADGEAVGTDDVSKWLDSGRKRRLAHVVMNSCYSGRQTGITAGGKPIVGWRDATIGGNPNGVFRGSVNESSFLWPIPYNDEPPPRRPLNTTWLVIAM